MAGSLLAAGLVLAACGSGGSGGSGASNSEADRSPAQILADAAAALRTAHSLHLDVDNFALSGGSGAAHFGVDLASSGAASATLQTEGVTAHFLYVGGRFYAQGKGFWEKFAGPQAANLIGERWVVVPHNAGLADFEQFLNISTLAKCFQLDHGTLSKGGTSSVDGQAAVVVVDKGDEPGTSPGKFYVAASGTAYPLQVQTTGATRPGTPPGGTACGGDASSSSPTPGTSSSGTTTIVLSRFNQPVSIKAPSDALDLQSLMSGGGG